MAIQIDMKNVMKGIAMIAKATQNPLARPYIEKILPDLGVSEADMVTLKSHEADYDRWIAAAEDAIEHGGQ